MRFSDFGKAIDVAVQGYGDLKIQGWKRSVGAAVHSTNIQGQFYRETLNMDSPWRWPPCAIAGNGQNR